MIEQIEKKIESHVASILEKSSIDFYEYQTLVSEINRQKAKIKEAQWDAEKEERNAALMSAMQNVLMGNTM